ncbi:MerR family transcriptional regulator [Kribbella qitaiheensis]|uniref:MerR family transcriptional regulator n=1 Tax=Kribbella qitaiheensis TaxID=1544730 RepID=A0A7G6X0M2_9ACTN|nr:MerR family transcriptional regulator [Kribbella qitaiheensis]QNE19787.1 MerR family transcriptional regulator [Kribbella qitaiheensis]
MRIAELSRVSGVPVPTIKYYLRESLLPPGELTSPNQASYGELHVRRLRLVRALIDLAGVPVAQVKEILAGLDSETMSLHDQIGRAHRAIISRRQLTSAPQDSTTEAAAAQVEALIKSRDWKVEADAPALTTLTETLATMRSLGQDHLANLLDAYADAVEKFTALEVAAVTSGPDHTTPGQIAESVIIGTILGETLISSLRLLSQESTSAHRWT